MRSKGQRILYLSYPYLLLIIFILVLMNWQIHYHATFLFSDTLLHFQRFYDAKMQIKTGNWSWFQTNYGFYHSGRVFNALYGPFFAYLNGLLLLVVKTWHRYQLVVFFLTYLTASVGMYQLAYKKAKLGHVNSLMLAMLYPTFGIVAGITKFNLMAIGGALAPYILMQGFNMVTDSKHPIHVFTLAFTMAIVAQIHVLSTVMGVLTLIPFAIIGFVKFKDQRKAIILNLLKAIGLALLLTANVWGSMLVMYGPNRISAPSIYFLHHHAIHLFSDTNVHGQIASILSILIVCQIIYIVFHFKQNVLNACCTLIAVFFLLLGSHLMPWRAIQNASPNVGRLLQFPYRFALVAYPLILITIGLTIKEVLKKDNVISKKVIYQTTMFLLVIALVQNAGLAMGLNQSRVRRYLNPDHVALIGSAHFIKNRKHIRNELLYGNSGKLFKNVSHTEPDYMPYYDGEKYHRASRKVYGKWIIDASSNYTYHVKKDHLYIYWNSKTSHNKILPIVMYKQSHLKVNGKPAKIIKYNHNCQPIVHVNKGKGYAELWFETPRWFWYLLIISIISWTGSFIYLIAFRVYKLVKKSYNN